ncbi:macro domain-containing protein [Vogesella sp. LYT5W]|uniref:Macro domain-containing protein n=1 Tax=Vogesella margarita TaxID=2984199 RepID=A0ABT5IR01_9NEIS|nr:macro domain-containing protein [Vogesella margarita]MDC7714982.1 macro domain-containing protein [Vogesella margarita]
MLTVRNGVRVEVWRGDITQLDVSAIVNAANVSLRGGGGVDAAVHRAAGGELLAACLRQGGCAAGDVCVTPGFALPARWVFHAVGPLWKGGEDNEAQLLASCYHKSLQLAAEKQVGSIAFAAISCGANHFPPLAAANIAWHVVETYLAAPPPALRKIVFVAFDDEVHRAWQKVLVGIS